MLYFVVSFTLIAKKPTPLKRQELTNGRLSAVSPQGAGLPSRSVLSEQRSGLEGVANSPGFVGKVVGEAELLFLVLESATLQECWVESTVPLLSSLRPVPSLQGMLEQGLCPWAWETKEVRYLASFKCHVLSVWLRSL
jgi:hypothetical protein